MAEGEEKEAVEPTKSKNIVVRVVGYISAFVAALLVFLQNVDGIWEIVSGWFAESGEQVVAAPSKSDEAPTPTDTSLASRFSEEVDGIISGNWASKCSINYPDGWTTTEDSLYPDVTFAPAPSSFLEELGLSFRARGIGGVVGETSFFQREAVDALSDRGFLFNEEDFLAAHSSFDEEGAKEARNRLGQRMSRFEVSFPIQYEDGEIERTEFVDIYKRNVLRGEVLEAKAFFLSTLVIEENIEDFSSFQVLSCSADASVDAADFERVCRSFIQRNMLDRVIDGPIVNCDTEQATED